MVRSVHPNVRGPGLVQEVLGLCADRLGPKLMNRCRPEKKDRKEHVKMLKRILKIEGWVPGRGTRWKIEGRKRRVSRKECKMLRGEFEVGDFMVQKRLVEHCQNEDAGRQKSVA